MKSKNMIEFNYASVAQFVVFVSVRLEDLGSSPLLEWRQSYIYIFFYFRCLILFSLRVVIFFSIIS